MSYWNFSLHLPGVLVKVGKCGVSHYWLVSELLCSILGYDGKDVIAMHACQFYAWIVVAMVVMYLVGVTMNDVDRLICLCHYRCVFVCVCVCVRCDNMEVLWIRDSLPWTSLQYIGYVYISFIWHGVFVGRIRSEMTSRVVDYSSHDSPHRSTKNHGEDYSFGIVYT